jgi:hypothetical protein
MPAYDCSLDSKRGWKRIAGMKLGSMLADIDQNKETTGSLEVEVRVNLNQHL